MHYILFLFLSLGKFFFLNITIFVLILFLFYNIQYKIKTYFIVNDFLINEERI